MLNELPIYRVNDNSIIIVVLVAEEVSVEEDTGICRPVGIIVGNANSNEAAKLTSSKVARTG